MSDRVVLNLSGTDRHGFLDGLVTNNVPRANEGLRYAALLTPQGKFIADFFLLETGDALLIDVAAPVAPALAQRLNMYRLRADVALHETDLIVSRGLGTAPENAHIDPRAPELGWRAYGPTDLSETVDWDALRVAHLIPETGIELTPDSYILELGFERLNGVDFRKGCFVGQEIVARMKHKTELRKGLVRVSITGTAQPGDAITNDGKAAGTLHTIHDGQALAHLRFDRVDGDLRAGDAVLAPIK